MNTLHHVEASPGRAGLLARMVLYIVIGIIGLMIFASAAYWTVDTLVSGLISVMGAALLANWMTMRIFERGSLADIGLGFRGDWWQHLGIGLAAAAIAGGLTVALPVALRLATWEHTRLPVVSWAGLAYTMFMLALGVVGEELLFRGYGFQVAVPALGTFGTLLPMGVLFATAHSGNLNVSKIALFNTFAWGVLLGWAVLRAGDLWLAIGLHAGWNWALPLDGVNLSGFTMKLTSYDVHWRIADVWTGGDYGTEGGLVCTVVVALLGAVLWRIPLRPGRLTLLRETGKVEVVEGGSTS